MVQISDQFAYILSPILLQSLFTEQIDLPFFLTMVPSCLLTIILFMCEFLPGGKNAGLIAFQATLEHNAKMEILNGDNELESAYLGHSGGGEESKNKKITQPRRQMGYFMNSEAPNEFYEDMMNHFSPTMSNQFSRDYDSMDGESMEI